MSDTVKTTDAKATKAVQVEETKTTEEAAKVENNNVQAAAPKKDVDTTQLVLLICVILLWFVGAILYLVIEKPEGMNKILTLVAIILPVIAGVLLALNVYGVIDLDSKK